MRILIVSDTHGRRANLEKVIQQVGEIQMLIHCGDLEDSEEYLQGRVDCEIHIVRGNCDIYSSLPREDEFWIGDHRVLLTHGHGTYQVKYGTEMLKERALERGAEIAIFGHTHEPVIDQSGSVTVINPGSLTQPRQEGRRPSFIMMDVDRFGVAHYALNYL